MAEQILSSEVQPAAIASDLPGSALGVITIMITTEPRILNCVAEMKALVDGLLGMDCVVTDCEPLQPAPGLPLTMARYLSRNDECRGAVVVDRNFLFRTGAALAMIPLEKVEEALESGSMPDELLDNGREILNVAASIFNEAQDVHLRIENLFHTPGPIPPQMAQVITRPRLATHMQFEIPNYGSGRISMYVR